MKYFSSLDKEGQQQIINQTHKIQSKEEMQQFVASLASEQLGLGGIANTDRFI